MLADVNIASVAAILADSTRANILVALSDGRALPAGELAKRAQVSPSTASAHLTKLVESGLLRVRNQGRHRYFCLADPAIIRAIEALAVVAPAYPVRSLRDSTTGAAIRFARTCYDHLAGKLGVMLAQALVEQDILTMQDEMYCVTPYGVERLTAFGLDYKVLQREQRLFVPSHIDWSERYPHIAGALGAALTHRLFDLCWIERTSASRAVRVTDAGRAGLQERFGVQI
jgi:DNA-binding transcriptional ArsR family regulator